MQKYLVAAAVAATLGMSGTASAVPPTATDGWTTGGPYLWNGYYIGGHFGAAWGSDKVKDLDDFEAPGFVTKNDTGVSGVAGVQTGYNWQISPQWLIGVEVDIGALDLNHSIGNRFGDTATLTSGIYGDVTGRVGYTSGQYLFYGKGGFAFFDGKGNYNGGDANKDTSTFTGWTAGFGLEYALTPAWSLKGEYQHFDFGKENSLECLECTDPDDNHFRFSHDLTVDTLKIGLNYHFGRGYVPLK